MRHIFYVLCLFVSLSAFADFTDSAADDSPAPAPAAPPVKPGAYGASIIHLNPVLGPSFVGVHGDVGGISPTIGYNIGGLAEFGTGIFTFQAGLIYSSYVSDENYLFFGNVRIETDYLSLPLFAKFNFMSDPNRTVYAKIGVMPAILTSKSASASFLWADYVSTSNIPIRSYDIPVVIAVGGAIPVTRRLSITVEANYLRGLVNINTGDGGSVYNAGLGILSGVNFAL